MYCISSAATAIFMFVGAHALQPKVHDVPQVAGGDYDNEWLTGIGTHGDMQCQVGDGCIVGSGAGTCTVMLDPSVPVQLGGTDGYDFSMDGLQPQFSTAKSDITITGKSASSHWNLCWKQDASSNERHDRRAADNVQDYCYYVNGICFLWASPCSGGCTYSVNLSAHPSFCPTLRYATDSEFSAALPTLNSNRQAFHQKCAAAVLDPFFIHCDYGGEFRHAEDNQWNELVLVCDGAGAIAAIGDPHLQNVHGERFDLMRPGRHVLLQIPKGERAEDTLLRVEADTRRLGGGCADLYFQELNVTGAWAEAKQVGGLRFQAQGKFHDKPNWIKFGKVQIKVAYGHTNDGIQYLNFYVKHLGHAGFSVGGLLGEDDHKTAAEPSPGCVRRTALLQVPASSEQSVPVSSVAEASFA